MNCIYSLYLPIIILIIRYYFYFNLYHHKMGFLREHRNIKKKEANWYVTSDFFVSTTIAVVKTTVLCWTSNKGLFFFLSWFVFPSLLAFSYWLWNLMGSTEIECDVCIIELIYDSGSDLFEIKYIFFVIVRKEWVWL